MNNEFKITLRDAIEALSDCSAWMESHGEVFLSGRAHKVSGALAILLSGRHPSSDYEAAAPQIRRVQEACRALEGILPLVSEPGVSFAAPTIEDYEKEAAG